MRFEMCGGEKLKIDFSSNKLCSLSSFYALRILLRDPEYQLIFVQENGMIGLKTVMSFFFVSSSLFSSSKWICTSIYILLICRIVTMNSLLPFRKSSHICWVSDNERRDIRTRCRYSFEIDYAHTKSCRTRLCYIQWNCGIIDTINESYARSEYSAGDFEVTDEYDRSNVSEMSLNEFICVYSRELYVKEIIKSETMDSLLQILLYQDLETKQ